MHALCMAFATCVWLLLLCAAIAPPLHGLCSVFWALVAVPLHALCAPFAGPLELVPRRCTPFAGPLSLHNTRRPPFGLAGKDHTYAPAFGLCLSLRPRAGFAAVCVPVPIPSPEDHRPGSGWRPAKARLSSRFEPGVNPLHPGHQPAQRSGGVRRPAGAEIMRGGKAISARAAISNPVT